MKNIKILTILFCGVLPLIGCDAKSPKTITDPAENVSDAQIIDLTTTNFYAFIQSEEKVLVDFWAPWCGPCVHQGKLLQEWSQAGKLPAVAKIGKINVDEESALAQNFDITAIPALYVFQKGKIIEKFEGVQDETTIVNALK